MMHFTDPDEFQVLVNSLQQTSELFWIICFSLCRMWQEAQNRWQHWKIHLWISQGLPGGYRVRSLPYLALSLKNRAFFWRLLLSERFLVGSKGGKVRRNDVSARGIMYSDLFFTIYFQWSQDEVITQLLLFNIFFNLHKFLHEFSGFQIPNHASTTSGGVRR